ncbi:MAG: hypothetical protein PHN80_04875 [Hespellia sp.]|nr:hypothetical protein [Hespellia sp.]
MRKLLYIFSVMSICLLSTQVVIAADTTQKIDQTITTATTNQPKSDSEIQVEIISPKKIDSSPVYDGTIDIKVKNNTHQTISNMGCYLTIVDVGRNQTYPVDEFGENAYQTRTIEKLIPEEAVTIQIPVHILYVGQFRFTASVIAYDTNQIYTGAALPVTITAVSNLQKQVVIGTSVVMPILLLGIGVGIWKRRKEN